MNAARRTIAIVAVGALTVLGVSSAPAASGLAQAPTHVVGALARGAPHALETVGLLEQPSGPLGHRPSPELRMLMRGRGCIRVVVETAEPASTQQAIARLGGRFERAAGGLVQAVVPRTGLRTLAQHPSADRVRAPWRHCRGRIDSDAHGTAVAEIVHEMAPEARLHLVCIDTEVDLAASIDSLKRASVHVVNHSMGWFGPSRGDGSGYIGDLVASFSYSPPLQYQTAAGSIVDPATSSAALAVGARCWQSRQLEPYSSQGPTIDGRVKPDLVGHDSVSGATYGTSTRCPSAFAGTSADSGELLVVVQVKRGGRVLATYRRGFLPAFQPTTVAVTWKAPARVEGRCQHCVTARDRAGNASPPSCARVVVS